MPSTYLSLHYHLVFGTKNREQTIRPEWQSRLHEYLGGTVRGLGGIPEAVGGVTRSSVHKYIENQAEHHRRKTFREELLEMLKREEVTIDSRYFD